MDSLARWLEGVTPPVVDLHLHTTASDGLLKPRDLITKVASTTLRVVAVTDHDSTDGLDEAVAEAKHHSHLEVITGIELSTYTELSEIHMLGLFIDHKNNALQTTLRSFRDSRWDAARRSVEKLNELGVRISWERVQQLAGGAIGRPHIARAMVEAGYISTPQEAFETYLGTNGLARVNRDQLSSEDGLRMIHEAGGVAVIAHPRTVEGLETDLEALVALGLEGIEVFAEKYGDDQRERYAGLAETYSLIPCGGSDYHAFGTQDELEPGTRNIPGPHPEIVEELRRRAGFRRERAGQPAGK